MTTEASIEYVLPQNATVRLRVFNEIGQLVFEEKTLGATGLNSTKILFSKQNVATGLLFFKLETASGTAVGRLVKQ